MTTNSTSGGHNASMEQKWEEVTPLQDMDDVVILRVTDGQFWSENRHQDEVLALWDETCRHILTPMPHNGTAVAEVQLPDTARIFVINFRNGKPDRRVCYEWPNGRLSDPLGQYLRELIRETFPKLQYGPKEEMI